MFSTIADLPFCQVSNFHTKPIFISYIMQISATKIPLEKFDLNYLRGPDGKPGLDSGLDWTGLVFLGG